MCFYIKLVLLRFPKRFSKSTCQKNSENEVAKEIVVKVHETLLKINLKFHNWFLSIPQKLDRWDFSEKKERTFISMHCSCALDVFWGLHFALSRYTLILVKMVLHVDPKSTLTPCFMSRYFLYKWYSVCISTRLVGS